MGLVGAAAAGGAAPCPAEPHEEPWSCPRGAPLGAELFVMLILADITPHIKAEGAAYKAVPRGRPARAAPARRALAARAEVSGDRDRGRGVCLCVSVCAGGAAGNCGKG